MKDVNRVGRHGVNPLKHVNAKPKGTRANRDKSGRIFKLREVRDVLEGLGLDPMEEIGKAILSGGLDEDTRLSALQAILRYTYPTLTSVDMTMDAKVKSYAISSAPLTDDEWAAQYADDSLESATGSTEGAD